MKPISPFDVIHSLLYVGDCCIVFVSSSCVLSARPSDRASFVSRYIVAAAVGNCAIAITMIVYASVNFMGVDGVVATKTQVFTHGVGIQMFLGFWWKKMLLQLILTGCVHLGGSLVVAETHFVYLSMGWTGICFAYNGLAIASIGKKFYKQHTLAGRNRTKSTVKTRRKRNPVNMSIN